MVGLCIGRQFACAPEQKDIHIPAKVREAARDDKAVAAIVARSAQDHRAMRALRQFGPLGEGGFDRATPGALHQLKAGDRARLDFGLFDGPHLGGSEQFGHV